MRRHRLLIIGLVMLGLLVPAGAVGALTTDEPGGVAALVLTDPHAGHVMSATLPPPAAFVGDRGPSFNLRCKQSHKAADDPIVYPKQPGASHTHVFFGNKGVNANSTYRSSLGAGTTCGHSADTAGYWIPTLTVNGKEARVAAVRPYYYAQAADRSKLKAFPADLRVVAGDRSATRPQNQNIIKWLCRKAKSQSKGYDTRVPNEPACDADEYVSLGIRFPDCWNGKDLDSPDHKSHMAYSDASRRCPASHPVKLPRLRISVTWATSVGTSAVRLSSGSRFGMHGDFWNTWDQRTLDRLVADCLRGRRDCGTVER